MIVEIILMMDSGHVRNMWSALSNKLEKSISLDFIIRIYHDARSSECQISVRCDPLADLCWRVCVCVCIYIYVYVFSLNVYYHFHHHTQWGEVRTQTPYTSIELLEALLLYFAEIDKAMATNVENSCKSIN